MPSPDLFATRPCRLALRALAPCGPGIFLELVGTIEGRGVRRGRQAGPDTVRIDRCTSARQFEQSVLVEATAGDDLDGLQPTLVEDPANFCRVLAEVAAVDTHTGDRNSFRRQSWCQGHDTPRGALGVVGIDQQDETLRVRARKMLKGQRLIVVRLDKGMRHRPVDRDAECNPGGYRRRPAEAGDITRPRGEHPGLGAMRSSQTIINQRFPGTASTIRAAFEE